MFLYFWSDAVLSSPPRLCSAEIFFRQQAAEYRAVGQQCDAVLLTECRHLRIRPAIDERILHLVRHDLDTGIDNDAEMLGIEIGQREVANFAFIAQVREMLQRVEIAPVAIIPPMKLQEIEGTDLHAPQRHRDRVLDNPARHRPGMRNPLRERLDVSEPFRAALRNKALPEPASNLR